MKKLIALIILIALIVGLSNQIADLNKLDEEREQMKAELEAINDRLESLNKKLEYEKAKVVDLSEYPNIEWVYENREYLRGEFK